MEGLYIHHILYAVVALVFVPLLFAVFAKKPSLIPTPVQNLFEMYIEFVDNMLKEQMGKEGRKFFPLVAGLGLFIFTGNLMGMIPGFESYTANINTTLALALMVFFLYNYLGFKKHGISYIKHFMGPIPAAAPIFFIIEVISHISRPITLALRLFANMTGGELITVVLIMLIPLLVPLPIMVVHLIAVFLQTYVFMILTTVYIAGALTEEAH
ncbi:ATP synthase F0 subcomplex A subunit [Persephonella hydrogeniphila]|uniref:ATP synthase subunit a n=1 Tax=Persephonella hydrogeniphila TaxID=198703 RepID=A0A285NAZ9_9AQUI|nr:F0F1 ATP synthase subunit A [Persephonella hydrogeniphila]SNZ06642.1 ATP synthase F0 subcomplex A subunit [Persephonella hydrogeniphila]